MGDGTAGLVVAVLMFVFGCCVLIGAVVWLYSAQSAKRRRAEARPAGNKE